MPWTDRQKVVTATGGVFFNWGDIGEVYKPGGPHGGRFRQGPNDRWWRIRPFTSVTPWIRAGITPAGPDAATALAIQAYGPRPVRTGDQPSSAVSGAQKRWDKDKELLIGIELPLGLESRFARVADGSDKGPGTLKPFSALLEDMEELADVVGLEEPTYIKRRYVGTSRLDPLDFAQEGVEYIVRFNNPDVGGPVNFRVHQMLFSFNVMVENWKLDLAEAGIEPPEGPDLFDLI